MISLELSQTLVVLVLSFWILQSNLNMIADPVHKLPSVFPEEFLP